MILKKRSTKDNNWHGEMISPWEKPKRKCDHEQTPIGLGSRNTNMMH
jgi:hypothetical protein